MDKISEPNPTVHSRDNQTLNVESFFTGTVDIQEIIKQYILEQRRAKDEHED